MIDFEKFTNDFFKVWTIYIVIKLMFSLTVPHRLFHNIENITKYFIFKYIALSNPRVGHRKGAKS